MAAGDLLLGENSMLRLGIWMDALAALEELIRPDGCACMRVVGLEE